MLLVEEDAESRELLATALEAEGAELWAVGRAQEALGRLRPGDPTSSCRTSGRTRRRAHAFIREVRALAPELGGHTPAVALTSASRPVDRARMLSSGFQTQLLKPVDPRELVLAVARLWPQRREEAG